MTIKQKKKPIYISSSFPILAVWCKNFATQLPNVAATYNIAQSLQDQVTDANRVIQVFATYETDIMAWLDNWRSVRQQLFDPETTNLSPRPFPTQPTFHPPGVPGAPYILQPFITAADTILANPNRTETDVALLQLVPAEPVRRQPNSANNLNYPKLSATLKNGIIELRIIRGDRWNSRSVLIEVDRTGNGVYEALPVTTANSISEQATLLPGTAAAVWCYRGIYVEGLAPISEWSPDIVLPFTQFNLPFGGGNPASMSAPTANGQAPGPSTPEPPASGESHTNGTEEAGSGGDAPLSPAG